MTHELKPNRTIAMGGPPHSGKTVFLYHLYSQSLARPEINKQVFKQAACPDGEGMWSAEADQALVKQLRQKGKFTPRVMNFYFGSIDGLKKSKELVYVDLGGYMSLENVLILNDCTDSMILSGDAVKMAGWQRFCREHGEIVTALQNRNIDELVRMQQEGYLEIIPSGKMSDFPNDAALREDLTWRIDLVREVYAQKIAALEARPINILASFDSELLEEQRSEIDQLLTEGKPLPEHLRSHVDTSVEPWTGTLRDLDRNRGAETYQEAIAEITEGIVELNRETKAEIERETKTEVENFESVEGGLSGG